ncbi:hypothetical protein [Phaeodactylibacter xiamenensis]|nr:hypothetical protein [Phaeodactylibacter xiamenensis]
MFSPKNLILLLALLWASFALKAQSCFIQEDDATGSLAFSTEELAELEAAACSLRAVFPTAFQNDFAVYDFGFYLHQQGYEGGMPQVFQDKIAEVEQESPYFLLFGRELSNNSGLGRFWVEVRLPNSDQYPCLVERSWSIINSVKTILQESATSDEYGLDVQKLKSAIEKLHYHVDHAVNCCPLDTQGRTPLCPACFWENEDIGVQLGYAGFIELKNISNIRVDSISTAFEEMKLGLKVDIGLSNEGVHQDFDITGELLEAKGLYGSDVSFSILKYNLDEEGTCSELAELYSSQIDIQSYGNSYKYQEEILILEKAGEYRVFSRSGGNGGYTNLGERPGLNRQPVILPAIILRIVLRRAVMAASNVAVNLFMEFVMERTFGDHGADCTWLETAGYIDTNPWRLSLWALEGALGANNAAYTALFVGADNAIVYLFQSGGNFQLDTFFLKFIEGAITGALAQTVGGAILNSKAFKRFFNKVESQTGSSIQALEFELIGLIPDFVRHPRKVKAWEALVSSESIRKVVFNLEKVSEQISQHAAKLDDFKLKFGSASDVAKQDLLDKIDVFFGFKPGKFSEDVVGIPKGSRPDPSDYLTPSYISQHVTKFDNEGGAFLVVKPWIEGGSYNTFPPKKFAMLRSDMQKAIDDYNLSGDVSTLENALGYNVGDLAGLQDELYVFYPNSSQYKFKVPDGNEIGANNFWEAGGVTSGGKKEAIMEGLSDPNEVIVHNKDINHLISQFDYEKL